MVLDIYGADSVLATGYIKCDTIASIKDRYIPYSDLCRNVNFQTPKKSDNEINFPSLPDSTFTFTYKLDSMNTIGCEYSAHVRGQILINNSLELINGVGITFILQDSTYRLCYSPILSLPNCK